MTNSSAARVLISFKKLHPDAVVPTRAYESAAGWDLYALRDTVLLPGIPTIVEVGLAVELPEGYFGWIVGRSSTSRRGILVLPGIIDRDYRGEVGPRVLWVPMHDDIAPECVAVGERIAQLLVLPHVTTEVQLVTQLTPTMRGTAGHGSTGR